MAAERDNLGPAPTGQGAYRCFYFLSPRMKGKPMTVAATHQPGSFEYLEAKIRRDAEGTSYGGDFEWICKWYLENDPRYRRRFRKVWRWKDWPDNWGRDCGIDLVAETHEGKLWAVQAKAFAPEHSIAKAEVDSFLSESGRKKIAYRLLIATTDNVGPNARQAIKAQHKPVTLALRGDLLEAGLVWPAEIGGSAPKLEQWSPKPHQQAAIADTLKGFEKDDRGRLIMACGTGKTLTGLWINEALGSRYTLLLVPSISLVQQNLKEWARHAKQDFDYLVVCSDESVASDKDDPALRYVTELGIDVTTDPKTIGAFLAKRRSRPAVVFATYQSSDRVGKGQASAKRKFDLAICDEAHRLVGHVASKFATTLDDKKIRARRRLFMTATPRYFTPRAKARGAEQDIELVSMDDAHVFGPEFHVLTFHDAITVKPEPLLTDYQVVVIGVTSAEAAAWVADAKLVRTKDGMESDARTLAAQIGLAKAMRQYDLRRMITFHRSIRRAFRFVDDRQLDSLPAVIGKLRPSSRPSGKLWARHISGETAASKRASLLRELGELAGNTRGLISNCACLGEGVDLPALDGIAFIDPKGSVVDIIQAVGRVIRRSADKKIGTIIIPVFIDESEDADHALENSAFDPVWQVLKALRAHDQRLADELDALRTAIGKERGGRIRLPANVVLDVPKLLLKDFEQSFYVRAVDQASERPPLSSEQILAWADVHKARTGKWPLRTSTELPVEAETWAAINSALVAGSRGLPRNSSLSRLLAEHRGVPNRKDLPQLTAETIVRWAKAHRRATGKWPNVYSGRISGTDDTWKRINGCLAKGVRGAVQYPSLAALLRDRCGVVGHRGKPEISIGQILEWADQYKAKHGRWPTANSGAIPEANENWRAICLSLLNGTRGLDGGWSLPRLLAEHRSHRNRSNLSRLTIRDILRWADVYKQSTGEWPSPRSGPIPGTMDTWLSVNRALQKGLRGISACSSLSRLLAEHRQARNKANLPAITVQQILTWADEHLQANDAWPNQNAGQIPETEEKWQNINACLLVGLRGLPGGSSIAKLLDKHRRGKR